jgi:tetratricopeptide (TPR) repeat protein
MRKTLLACAFVSLTCASFCVPVWAQTNAMSAQQSTTDNSDDALLERLARAQDELESRHIADALLRRWSQANSDTINLLVARAQAAEAAGASPLARGLLDYVVLLAPNWAEGFVRRARVRAAVGDDGGAQADLETALRLEPRRFDALTLLSVVAERSGDKQQALSASRRALALQPMNEDLRKTEERLKSDVEGHDI